MTSFPSLRRRNSGNRYVFEPEILREVAHSHLDLPLEEMIPAITRDLAERYPGLIETEPEWFYSNAGGTMGQVAMLYASLREYVIFFGSPIGSGGHTGRYRFVDDHSVVLDGEMWYYGEGDLRRTEYRRGDSIHLRRGEAKGFRMVDGAYILEYARGPIPTMLPFGLADTVFSTLDLTSLIRTCRLYARHVLRSTRRRRFSRSRA